MANRAAIVIGVDRTGDLPALLAARSGAKDFAGWARLQGYEVTLITDEDSRSVTIDGIKQAVKTIVKQNTCEQLLIYFAGHGILRAAETELWLLSEAPEDSNAAVDLAGSCLLARNSGIEHIVFISDTCRSIPTDVRFNQVGGSKIFPNQVLNDSDTSVDLFYATRPGDPAYEIATVPDAEARRQHYGIFTKVLLTGLNGSETAVQERWLENNRVRLVIPAWKLKPYLKQRVPDALGEISIRLQQFPEIRVESHKPLFLAELDPKLATANEVVEDEFEEATIISTASDPLSPVVDAVQLLAREIDPSLPFLERSLSRHLESHVPDPDGGRVRAEIERLIPEISEDAFERTGFIVTGEEVVTAHLATISGDIFDLPVSPTRSPHAGNPRSTHVEIDVGFPEESSFGFYDAIDSWRTVILRFASGTGTALAILPGFVGTVVVENGRVVSVSYLPTRSNSKYQNYIRQREKIRKRHALVATAARHGAFSFDPKNIFSYENVDKMAEFLRLEKALDPTLGLYAAYAYIQIGKRKLAKSVYDYMTQEPEPVLFDVALLAGELNLQQMVEHSPYDPNNGHPVAPWTPMLTQGWSLLETLLNEDETLPPYLDRMRRQLLPALWTTLTWEGLDLIESVIRKGDIV